MKMNEQINQRIKDVPVRKSHSQAIVVGGSLAGLLAARVLSEHFERVTVLERDSPADQPAPRKGVPQARHLHILLARGRLVLEQLFPGLVEELVGCGAPVADMGRDLAWLTPAGWGVRCNSGINIVGCSRDLLEWRVRQRLTAIGGVRFYGGCDVTGLSTDEGGTRINGVKARVQHRSDREILLPCDLAVDASGRGSHAPEWLTQLGYEPPDETVVNAHLGYTSRVYRRHPALIDCKGVYVQPAPPDYLRGGALFPIEGDRWILTLAGYGRDYPPTDETGFVEFARSLRTQRIYDAIRDAEPLSPIFAYRATENRLRHYELMSQAPDGIVVLGDAACAFNPVYAQGMSMAALGAATLDECLRDKRGGDLSGFGRRFQMRLSKVNSDPWRIATGEDLRVRGCEGGRPTRINQLLQRYFDGAVKLSTEDAQVRKLVLEVFNMLKPASRLFHPGLVTRILSRPLIRPFRTRFQAVRSKTIEQVRA
jgi:2-polyprenyl-6-methoxyphenol hydroxylase-like FAD-dependent oxidoreductase